MGRRGSHSCRPRASRPLPLRRGTNNPVVTNRTGSPRRRGLELLAKYSLSDLKHDVLDRLSVSRAAQHRNLEIIKHVVVSLLRGLQAPVLASGERVKRQLYVVAKLLGSLGPRGLVVDELVLDIPPATPRSTPTLAPPASPPPTTPTAPPLASRSTRSTRPRK
jgi:hypothetical protein